MSQTPTRSGEQGGTRGLFLALVAVAFGVTFSTPLSAATPFRIALLIAAGVAYTLIGLFVNPHVERSGTLQANMAFLLVELVLAGVIVYLSEARAWLIVLPMVAHSIEALPGGWSVFGCMLTALTVLVSASSVITSAVGPDGEPVYPLFSGSFWEVMIPYAMQVLLAYAFVVLYTLAAQREYQARTEVERLAAEVQQANRQLREYAAQAEELATVHERNRLAREIHDGLGHYLTGINMQIQAGRAVLDHDREVAMDAFDQAQALAQEGLTEVRRSVAALRASPLDNQSLPQAIESLVNECRAAGIATAFSVLGEARSLAPQTDLALYRVAQEGMTNMRKYAQASSAEITLDYRDRDEIRLTVRDQGIGTDDPSGGYGLVGVRERVHLLGGTVQVETAAGEGFSLQVRVPAELSRLAGQA